MSVIVSLSLVLVLLCFDFHACNARSLGVIVHNETAAEEFQHSTSKKNEELIDSARVSVRPDQKLPSTSNALKELKEESGFEEMKANSESNKPGKHDRAEFAGSVSWRVPHKKRGEQEPGFNFDYLPPKTHPPVHN